MEKILTINRGDSLSIAFNFPAEYDMSRFEGAVITLGRRILSYTIEGLNSNILAVQIPASVTEKFLSVQQLSIKITDSLFGEKTSVIGWIETTTTNVSAQDPTLNNGYNLYVPLVVTEATIAASSLMYNVLRGQTAYEAAVAGGYEGTYDEFRVALAAAAIAVPYTGATNDVDLNEHSILVDSVRFEPTPRAIARLPYELFVDEDNQTIAMRTPDGDDVDLAVKGEDDNFVTDADIVKLNNLSGINTGDQDLSALQPKAITPISGMAATTVEGGLGELNDIVRGPDKTLLQGYYLLISGQYKDDELRNEYVCLKDTISAPFRLEVKDGYFIHSVCVMHSDLQFYFTTLVSSEETPLVNKTIALLDTGYKYRVNIRKVGGGEISKDEDIIKKLEIIDISSGKQQQVSILREGYQVRDTGIAVANGVSLISPIGVAKASKVYIDYPLKINSQTDCWCAFFGKDNTILSVVKPFSTIMKVSTAPNSFIFAIDVPADAYYIVCSKDDYTPTPIRVWLDDEDEDFRFINLTRGYYKMIDGVRRTNDAHAPQYFSSPQLITPSFYLRVRDDYRIDSVTKYDNDAYNSFGAINLESTRISINDGFTYGINIVREDGGEISTSVFPWDIIESFGDVEGQGIDAVTFIPSDNDGTIALGLNYKMKDYTENDTRYLSMTDDNGVTWNTVENTYGDIVFVHFFLNGNVLFATSKKSYYSSDNLATIQESVVYDLDGSAFVADEADYFYQQRNYANENCVVDGTERLLWGEYYIGSVSPWDARIWETHDNGQTINCIFKYGTSQIEGQVISSRHSHGVFFNKYNQKWYGLSGDGGNSCNVIEISYNGSYIFSLIGKGDNYKFANVFFDANSAYFITDYTIIGTIRGILRCPIAQLRDFNNYKYIWKVDGNVPLTGYAEDAVGRKFITPDGVGYNKLFFAESGLMFKRLFVNFPNAMRGVPVWIFGPDYNGEYYVFCWKGGYSTDIYKFVLSGNLYNLSKAMEREGVILK